MKPRAIRERETYLQEQFEALQQQMVNLQQQGPPGVTSGFQAVETETGASQAVPIAEDPDEISRPVRHFSVYFGSDAKRKAFSMPLVEGGGKRRKAEGGTGWSSATTEPGVQNKVLFLENLPADCRETEIAEIFSGMEGFERIRLIPVHNVGFVDFKSIANACIALEGEWLVGSAQFFWSACSARELRPGVKLCASFAKR